MRVAVSVPVTEQGQVDVRALVWARVLDYIELSKPKIAVMGLVTVAIGYALSALGRTDFATLGYSLFGIAMVAISCSVFNQLIERHTDAQMLRTCRRPLPSGRLGEWETIALGVMTGSAGLVCLVFWVNALTASLAALTLFLYTLVYTPLKRVSYLNTLIGAIPGALPPVLGWTAAGGRIDEAAFALFAMLFVWQFPHFMAIAWIYREDYARAGMKMIPSHAQGSMTSGWVAVGYALALIPVSGLPCHTGLAGNGYLMIALSLGALYAAAAAWFCWNPSRRTARWLLWVSLVYLPLTLLALLGDHYRLLT